MLKDLPYFNAKIKVGEVNKYKRREAIIDKIIKQLPSNSDIYYIEHNKSTDSFRVRKDNKIKIQVESGDDDDLQVLKQIQSHPRNRLMHKVRRSKRLANKKKVKESAVAANTEVRESVTRPVIMPTGILLAAGKIKRKYARNRKKERKKDC